MNKEIYNIIASSNNETINERHTCAWCGDEFAIFDLQRKIEKQLGISHQQELCFSCTQRNLMRFRNERKLYRNKCCITGKPIISMYPPENNIKVCASKVWHEQDFSSKETLPEITIENIDQEMRKLYKETPQMALLSTNNENSDYANLVLDGKNVYLSYLCFLNCENVLYSYYTLSSKNIIDSYQSEFSELIYEGITNLNSYNCFYSYNIKDCSNIYFSTNLQNCQNCIFSSNLVNQSYCIENKQYNKEEWKKEFEKLKENMKSHSGLQKLLSKKENLFSESIFKANNLINCENSYGNNLTNSKNAILCFDSLGLENCVNAYGTEFLNSVNCIGGRIEYSYNSCYAGNKDGRVSNSIGVFDLWCSSDVYHSRDVYFSQNVLFSVGINNKSYSLLNRILPKEEWKENFNKIKGLMDKEKRWGEFLSNDFNPFPYNDSPALEYHPIHKIKIAKKEISNLDKTNLDKYDWEKEIFDTNGRGTVYVLESNKFISKAILDLGGEKKLDITWRTKELEITVPKGIESVNSNDLPDHIDDIDESILQKAIICNQSGRPYRIIKMELDYYRKHGLPIPRQHPEIRHERRKNIRLGRVLHINNCNKCGETITTPYNKDSKETIYCKECYDEFVYR